MSIVAQSVNLEVELFALHVHFICVGLNGQRIITKTHTGNEIWATH